MKSAIRRHHYERRKKAIIRLSKHFPRILDDATLGMLADTRVPCSCPMCGNPRKHFNKKTRQELIADLYELE